ncbi:hypothetical protein ASF28_02920 [Methylobacterium sp. Leaf99]|nr:hypothetical protein ASF28_02920 [Methylobacterium sp. Leaf99]
MVQRILPRLILGLTLAGTPSFALASQAEDLGIDCKKAISTPDATLCINDAYEVADKLLNEAYRAVMASIDKGDTAPEVRKDWRKALVEAQRRWVAYRDAECEVTGFEWYGGTGRSGAVLDCARALTEARAKALKLHADPR